MKNRAMNHLRNSLLALTTALTCLASAPAQALDIYIRSTDAEISDAQLRDAVRQSMPTSLADHSADYRLVGILETAKYQDVGVIYFFSVMLNKQVHEQGTGKPYWVLTGGVRGNGVSEGGTKLLELIQKTMQQGSASFRSDQ